VKITNHSHRMAYMVALLALAVALTAVLVLASERNAASQKGTVLQQNFHSAYLAVPEKGDCGCAAA
jgi:hypothetical protein